MSISPKKHTMQSKDAECVKCNTCLSCGKQIKKTFRNQSLFAAMQQHLWGIHKLPIERSHLIARKITEHYSLTMDELAELKTLETK